MPKLTLAASLAATPPSIDGEFQEEGWRSAATTGAFSDPRDPTAVVAHTEARVLGDLQGLYLGLFAADEDIVSSDYVGATLQLLPPSNAMLRLEIGPAGSLRCHAEGQASCKTLPAIRVAVDRDGTLDNSSDYDEEWTVEVFVPWTALGQNAPPPAVAARLFRRDQPKERPLRMLVWGACPRGSDLPCGRITLTGVATP